MRSHSRPNRTYREEVAGFPAKVAEVEVGVEQNFQPADTYTPEVLKLVHMARGLVHSLVAGQTGQALALGDNNS